MYLDINTNEGLRHINLDQSFFKTTTVRKNGVLRVITPSMKASDLANDLYGKNLRGYKLYENNRLITKYDRESNVSNSNGGLPTRDSRVAQNNLHGSR